MWILDLAFTAQDSEEWQYRQDICINAIGEHPSSAGTWLGKPMQRDMQWEYETKKEAQKAKARLIKAGGIKFTYCKIDKYEGDY